MKKKNEHKKGTLRLRGTVTIDLSLDGFTPQLTREYLDAVEKARCQFTDKELRRMAQEESDRGQT